MSKNPTRGNFRKRMRLPNGFGRITKIKGRLRKPYRAMVTVGKDEQGRPIGKLLKPQAYFETYNEAYAALLEYNRDPYDVRRVMTVEQLYNLWSEEYYPKISKSSVTTNKLCWEYSSMLKDMDIREIRLRHIKAVFNEGTIIRNGEVHRPTNNLKIKIKTLWNNMFNYAVENEYIDQNRIKDLKTERAPENINAHTAYSSDELKRLWANSDDYMVRVLLLQCYSGMRPGELVNIKTKNINLDDNIIIAGSKTEAGRDRIIPIHPLVKPFVQDFLSDKYNTLLKTDCYSTLTHYMKDLKKRGIVDNTHKLHDGRKTFITMAKKYNLNEYAIKYIVGHSIRDLTESVYTERDPKWLYEEICKIQKY